MILCKVPDYALIRERIDRLIGCQSLLESRIPVPDMPHPHANAAGLVNRCEDAFLLLIVSVHVYRVMVEEPLV